MTRTTSLTLVLLAAALASPNLAAAETLTFADAPIGALPQGFEAARTGKGAPAEWKVVEDPSAAGGKALAQVSADRTDYRFPLAVYGGFSAKDLAISVRCKPVAGKVDEACGVAVRPRLDSPSTARA